MPKPEWLSLDVLPRLTTAGLSAHADESLLLIEWLQADVPQSVRATLENRSPVQPWSRSALPEGPRAHLQLLRNRYGDALLDAWASALVRAWLEKIGSGTARRFPWVVPAAGLLGGDACAALLGPHLRGKNHTLRCPGEVGVAALVEIGTRGALLELAQLAAKCPGRSRGEMAGESLRSLASSQGLTPDQLQDRILPDSGLDQRGERCFDYGSRQFQVALNEHLQPVLRDPSGREMTALPRPTAKDDADKAALARIEWKTAKANLQQAARWLSRRFETAMISGESWRADDFATFFGSHPLARHVVRRVLWTTTNTGSPIRFRVAEDDTFADATDGIIQRPDDAVSLRPVHPLEMTSEELTIWQQVFADYRIIGAFPQLDRPAYRLTATQEARTLFTEFPHPEVEAAALVYPLETRGWVREEYPSSGMIQQHRRVFDCAGICACLEYEPGAFVGDIQGSSPQKLRQLFFVPRGARPVPTCALPLASISTILRSEVLRDLHALIPAR